MALLEKRQFIARLVRSRLTLEPETSDLWQEFSTTEHGTKRKLYDKLRAMALDNDLAGDGSEAMAHAAVGSVAEMMVRVRSGRWNSARNSASGGTAA